MATLFIGSVRPALSTEPGRFAEADAKFQQRHVDARAREALEDYRKFYAETPDDPEAAWRVAMACYFVGIRLTDDKDARKKLYAEGRDVGKVSLKLVSAKKSGSSDAPTPGEKPRGCAPCHFWTAINMALYGKEVGIFKMLFTLGEIQELVRKSIEIDPSYAFGGAYRLRGLIEWNLPGILGGSDDRARDYFQKAIELAPDEPLNYLFLAKLLKKEFDDLPKALEVARKGLGVPPLSPERLESKDALEDLKKFLSENELRPET